VLPVPIATPFSPSAAQNTQPIATSRIGPASLVSTPVPVRMVRVTAPAGTAIRAQPDAMARVIGDAPTGEELAVLLETVIGSDGHSRWIAVAYGDTTGYVQSEDVSAPYLPASSAIEAP
jgi:hypothetical protein